MKKIVVLTSFILIFLSCKITKRNQYNRKEVLSMREMRERLEIYYWQKWQNDSKISSDTDTLYVFRFNRHNKRKGILYKIDFKSSSWKIYSERKFNVLDYKDNSMVLRFQDTDNKQISKLYFKSWVEMFLDNVKYSPVRIE